MRYDADELADEKNRKWRGRRGGGQKEHGQLRVSSQQPKEGGNAGELCSAPIRSADGGDDGRGAGGGGGGGMTGGNKRQ
ncbi:unnamed protein product [Calypogeia fissa]